MPRKKTPWYTLDDIAKELSVDRKTVVRMVSRGDIIAHQICKQYRVSPENYNNFKTACIVKSPSKKNDLSD